MDALGEGPLHIAAGMGAAEVVVVLLAAGCPINAVDSTGRTARHAGSADRRIEWAEGVALLEANGQ